MGRNLHMGHHRGRHRSERPELSCHPSISGQNTAPCEALYMQYKNLRIPKITYCPQSSPWDSEHFGEKTVQIGPKLRKIELYAYRDLVFSRDLTRFHKSEVLLFSPWDSEHFGEKTEWIGPKLRKIELYAYWDLVFSRNLTRFHKSEVLRFFPLRFWAFWRKNWANRTNIK